MQVPSLLLLGVVGAGLVFALWASSRALLTSGITGMRLHLWSLHDEIVDNYLEERYLDPRRAMELLRVIRTTIFHARDFTFLQVFGSYALLHNSEDVQIVMRESGPHILEGNTGDELLDGQITQVHLCLSRAVFRTSLLGRFGWFALPGLYFLVKLLQRQRPERVMEPVRLARKPVRIEVDLERVMEKARGFTTDERELAGAAC